MLYFNPLSAYNVKLEYICCSDFSEQFDVVATDQGSIQLTSLNPARVTVNVIRNRQAPVFINTPYFTTINRTLGIGLSVFEVEARDSDTQVSTSRSLFYLHIN